MVKTRGTFDQQLAVLRDMIIKMGEMTETAIDQSITALKEQNKGLAQEVIASDEQINVKRYDIEELCLELIATQQPAAKDLRAIIAGIHISTELERMGDYASGISKLAIQLADQPHLKPLIDVPRMAEIDRQMIKACLEAYFARDPEMALQTARRDAEIDELYGQTYRELLTYMLSDPTNIGRATRLLWIIHNLERIADRVTNICERVIFMATGEVKELKF